MSAACTFGSHTVHHHSIANNSISAPHNPIHICFRIRSRKLNDIRASASLSLPSQSFSARESPGDYSQLRRGGYLPPAKARKRLVSHVRDARRSDGKSKEEGLHSSLYVRFDKLPPDGKSLLDEEATCNPEEQRCLTPVYIWEKKCQACYGTGHVASSSRRGHRQLYTCLACHGLGFVRRASSSEIPDLENGAVTLGRDIAKDSDDQ